MKRDLTAWTGTALFGLLLALLVLRPANPFAREHGTEEPPWGHALIERDLGDLLEDTLCVLVLRDPLSWEEHPGAVTGLEWELMERFARKQHLHLKALPVDHPDSALLWLQQGRGDVIAAQLCPEGPARRFISFSQPYRFVAPLRAQLHSDPLVRATVKKKRQPGFVDTLYVSPWSPFLGLPDALDSNLRMTVLHVDSCLPEDVLVNAATGRYRVALVTDATGTLEARRMPHMAFNPRMGRSVPLAFGLRTNSPKLREALDTHLASATEKEAIANLLATYTNGQLTKGALRTLPEMSVDTNSISPFDSLFQASADATGMEWTLFAAVAFKESRFNSTAHSFAGASGLMQMMPRTAEMLGVDTADGVAGHVRGATGYLADLDTMWRKSVPGKDQRLKFALASYNAGPGHIIDAQRLAAHLGLDPKLWDGNVERAVLLLAKPRYFTLPMVRNGYCRGHETFWYVRDVISAFGQFRKSRK